MVQKKVVDRLGRTVEFSYPPKRIISLVPGITDTLYALELEEKIVGRTRYCIHPKEKVQQAEIIGGTKQMNLEKIRALQPDLIFAEKEENTKEMVEELEKEFPVYVSEVQSVQDAYNMMNDLGELTNRKLAAEQLLATIQAGFQSLPKAGHGKRIAYVIWRKPYMVVGDNTYIQSIFEMMGFENAFSAFEGRYPAVTEAEFQKAELDDLFLASEPFPFKDEHVAEFSKLLPGVNIRIVDGEMFWYGPRMIEAAKYINRVLLNV